MWEWADFYSQFGLDPDAGKEKSKKAKKAEQAQLWAEQQGQ